MTATDDRDDRFSPTSCSPMTWPSGTSASTRHCGPTSPVWGSEGDLAAPAITHDVRDLTRAAACACLTVAVDDEIVPLTEGEANFAVAAQPKSFVPLLASDHLVTSRASADRLAAVLLGWFDETLA